MIDSVLPEIGKRYKDHVHIIVYTDLTQLIDFISSPILINLIKSST